MGETKQFRPKHFLARLSVAYTAACQLQHKTLLLQQQQQGGGKAAGAGSGGFGGGSANSHNKFFNMQSAAARGGASGGGGGSSSSGNMAALLAQANCVGEASCGFDSVAKVVLPPSGVHTSYSNNNISALSMAHTHGLKK